MSIVGRLAHQVRYDLLVFRRNPAAVVFSILIPVVFFILIGWFVSTVSDEDVSAGLTAAYVAFAVIGACFVNMAMTMTVRRERGLLKRVRTTPLPPWMFVASQGCVALVLAFGLTSLMTVASPVVTGLSLRSVDYVSVAGSLLVGVPSFVALGIALSCLVPSEEAAPAMVQGIALPAYFLGGVFLPATMYPDWIRSIAQIFPVYHFVQALSAGYLPGPAPFGHWAVVAAWGMAGALVVARWFTWMPRR